MSQLTIPEDLPDEFGYADLADMLYEVREQFDDDVQVQLLRDDQFVYLACALAEDVEYERERYAEVVGYLQAAITPQDMSYIAGNEDVMPTSPASYLIQTYLDS